MAICGRIIHFDDLFLYAKLPKISHFTGFSHLIEYIAKNLVIVIKHRYHSIGIVMN